MSIKRVNHGRYHSYVDTDTGLKIPSVTTITGDGVPKPALINWAGNATAEYAVDHWNELADLPPSKRLKVLQGARYADRDAAANRGTQVHKMGQKLVAGERVTIPDGLEGHVQSYVRFLDDFDVQPVLVEAVVVSHTHKICGTLDLLGDLIDPDDPDPEPRRVRWLLDLKTSRSGVFGESALQLAGYRFSDCWVDGDGKEYDMPEVERTGVVHIRADGYDLVPVEAGEAQYRAFLYAQQIGRFVADSRELIGEPIVSPTASTYRLARDD
jgi:hypothetical protein